MELDNYKNCPTTYSSSQGHQLSWGQPKQGKIVHYGIYSAIVQEQCKTSDH